MRGVCLGNLFIPLDITRVLLCFRVDTYVSVFYPFRDFYLGSRNLPSRVGLARSKGECCLG